jgi:hypothetical protein
MAAMTAYLAYQDPNMLSIAQDIWDFVSSFQITADQAISGQHPLRNVTFSGTCNKSRGPAFHICIVPNPNDLLHF